MTNFDKFALAIVLGTSLLVNALTMATIYNLKERINRVERTVYENIRN